MIPIPYISKNNYPSKSVIDRANDIFKATDWLDLKEYEGKGSATGFAFTIKKIEIWNDPSNPDKYLNQTQILRKPVGNQSDNEDEEHPQCSQPDSRDICRYLKQFSKTGDHGDVCLGLGVQFYFFVSVD